MALSNPRIIYGIHSLSPYSRTTKVPCGILKVMNSANLSLSAEQELLYAGSNRAPWASESKTLSTELSCKVSAYPDFLFSLFLGASVTSNVAEASGAISVAAANFSGTSIINGSNGISAVSVIPSTGAANLKFGKYVLKATSSTVVKLYLMSDVDGAHGTAAPYTDDTLEVASITVAAGTNDVAALGLRFTGVGTPAFTVGHSATFEVRSPNTASTDIVVGASASTMPAFGCILMAQKRATGEVFEIDAPYCVGSGLPITLEEMKFSEPELKMIMLYDSTTDKVFSIRHAILA